jgi:GxxExxY protein
MHRYCVITILPLSREHERIGAIIVDSALKVHRELGPGLLEKFYEACLCYELRLAGLQVSRQLQLPMMYKEVFFDEALRIDLLVEGMVIVEAKAVDHVNPVWNAQILSHLKITGHRLDYLINFNVPLIKQGIRRIIL